MGNPTSTVDLAAPVAIDPRIRARRIEVRRTEGRRKLQRVVDLGLVLAVAAAFVGALWTPLLDVDAVHVQGADRTGADVVRQHAGITPGDPLIGVHLGEVGSRVAALAWVHDVSVHRQVDGTVTLVVRERTPVVVVGAGLGAMFVDQEGRVLGPATGLAGPTLPTLLGVAAPPGPGAFLPTNPAHVLRLAEGLRSVVPGAISTLQADGLVASLAQGGAVRFGDSSQLDAKLRSLRTVLEQVDLRCLALIDLRLPGSPVLTREEQCS